MGTAVTFYGGGVRQGRFGLPSLIELAPKLETPWLGLYGELDKGIPIEEVEELREAATGAPAPTEIIRYPGRGLRPALTATLSSGRVSPAAG